MTLVVTGVYLKKNPKACLGVTWGVVLFGVVGAVVEALAFPEKLADQNLLHWVLFCCDIAVAMFVGLLGIFDTCVYVYKTHCKKPEKPEETSGSQLSETLIV